MEARKTSIFAHAWHRREIPSSIIFCRGEVQQWQSRRRQGAGCENGRGKAMQPYDTERIPFVCLDMPDMTGAVFRILLRIPGENA